MTTTEPPTTTRDLSTVTAARVGQTIVELENTITTMAKANGDLEDNLARLAGLYFETQRRYHAACAALLARSPAWDLVPIAEFRELEEITGVSLRVIEAQAVKVTSDYATKPARRKAGPDTEGARDAYRSALHFVARELCRRNDRPIPDSIQPTEDDRQNHPGRP